MWLIRSRTCDGSRIDSRTAVTRCLGRNGGGSKAACGRGQVSGIRSGTSRIGLPPLNVSMPGLAGSLPGSHLDWPCGKADPACGSRNGGGFLRGIAGNISHVGLPGDIRWKPTREDAIWVGEAIVTGAGAGCVGTSVGDLLFGGRPSVGGLVVACVAGGAIGAPGRHGIERIRFLASAPGSRILSVRLRLRHVDCGPACSSRTNGRYRQI